MKEPILVKLKMKFRYKSLLSILGILIISISLVGILYLFYDKVLSVEVNGVLSINYIDGKKINTNENKYIKFSVSNESDNIAYYYISFNSLFGNGTYKILDNGTTLMEGNLNTSSLINSDYISLDAKQTKTYVISINSNDNIKGNFSIEIPNEPVVTFSDTILNNSQIKEPITKIGVEVATEDEGLIKSNDDLGVSYYFRGNVSNNYVNFADKDWRIVRINGDGTIRLILDGVTEEVGSYYQEEDSSFAYHDVLMYTYLNDWFQDNLKSEEQYIANTSFCNDIVKDSSNNYLAYTRIMTNKIPTLNCLGEIYSSNIGLLTIDEYVLAGGAPILNNTNSYLYNSTILEPWFTMSGARGNNDEIYMFMINTNGGIITNIEGSLYRQVRPVINLIKNIEVSGDGTKNNPYKIIE